MSSGLFVVISEHGAGWDRSRPLRDQRAWPEHATFMNALVDDGFVIVGGPLNDGALLIVTAKNEEEIRARLAPDPWMEMDLLRVTRVEPWEVLLGELPARSKT